MDQADRLRGMLRWDAAHPGGLRGHEAHRARTLAVTSGCGGVGKSQVALNMAVALAARGRLVTVIDFAATLGGLDLLAGLKPDDPPRDGGPLRLGPHGVRFGTAAALRTEGKPLAAVLATLATDCDDLILDLPPVGRRPARELYVAADRVLLLTPTEPAGVAEAYAAFKRLTAFPTPIDLLVTLADRPADAARVRDRLTATAAGFLNAAPGDAGHIPRDHAVCRAAHARVPFLLAEPRSPASRAIDRLVDRLNTGRHRPAQPLRSAA